MTTTILTRDIATRYAALRAAVLASVGPEQFAQIEYDTQQSLLESAPVPEDADLVSIADLSDLDGDEDTDPVDDEETRREVKAARTTYSWIVRFEVCGTWIADGFDLTHERALDMLATDLGMANIGEELNARVIAAPPADTIAQEQGYKSAADKFERDANRDVDAEARVSKALDGAREAELLAEVERTYEEAKDTWTGRTWDDGDRVTPESTNEQIAAMQRHDEPFRVTSWGTADDGSYEAQQWRHREDAAVRGLAAQDEGSEDFSKSCDALRELAEESDVGVAKQARMAEDAAAHAVVAARDGNKSEALQLAEQAAAIERAYGDAPTWGPFAEAVRAWSEHEAE